MANSLTSRRLLSTGEVARLSGFSPSAVLQWIHSGKLRSYSSPGGQHRVAPPELLRFLTEHGMRVPAELRPDGSEDDDAPPPAARPQRVLLIEDDSAVRDVLARMLTASGLPFEIEGAESGVEGCIQTPLFKPHLIVLDIEMPGFDGAELCRWIKESDEAPDTKVLLLASSPHDEKLRVAMLAGADEWLLKPVRVVPFLALVTRLLDLDAPGAMPDLAPCPAAAIAPVTEPV